MAQAMQQIPYVGITGVGTPAQSEALISVAGSQLRRRFMLGALVSDASMEGRPDRWPRRYPVPSSVPDIFSDHPTAFNVVHYNTRNPSTLAAQLTEIVGLVGKRLHGFQLNMAWPAPRQLELFRAECPSVAIIIQLNREAFDLVAGLRDGVSEKLRRDYGGLFDHALLDLSAGHGEILDPQWAAGQLRRLYSADLGTGVGVAGGLCAETLPMIEPLIREFPGLSIDAEGRLRDGDDLLDLGRAKEYLLKALEMFEGTKAEPAGR